MAHESIVQQSGPTSSGDNGHVDAQTHRAQSYALWQQLATQWERGRRELGAPTLGVSAWLVDRLAPKAGQTVLELAAGTGEAGFLAAGRLGDDGLLISSDFAPSMVEAARRVAQEIGVKNAEFRVLDGEQLELTDACVDGVICRYGYMLMADPQRALTETRRVLRPGGRLVLSVWGEPQRNPWMTVANSVMTDLGHMPRRHPDGPGMFRLRDPATLRALLSDSGFAHCELVEMPILHHYRDADELWEFASEFQGPIALAIAKLSPSARDAVRTQIEQRVRAFRVGNEYHVPGLSLNALAY